MSTVAFSLPTKAEMTANQRLHHMQRAAMTKDIRAVAKMRALATSDVGKHERAHVTVHVGWPDKRRRDVHNIMPTIKACIDGFVDAGLLPDDDDKHLVGPDLRPFHNGIRGHVALSFEFVEVAL